MDGGKDNSMQKKEEFVSYHINRLLNSDFGRKPYRFCTFKPTSLTGFLPAARAQTIALLVLAPFASSSPTPNPLAQALANTPIYPM